MPWDARKVSLRRLLNKKQIMFWLSKAIMLNPMIMLNYGLAKAMLMVVFRKSSRLKKAMSALKLGGLLSALN